MFQFLRVQHTKDPTFPTLCLIRFTGYVCCVVFRFFGLSVYVSRCPSRPRFRGPRPVRSRRVSGHNGGRGHLQWWRTTRGGRVSGHDGGRGHLQWWRTNRGDSHSCLWGLGFILSVFLTVGKNILRTRDIRRFGYD